MMMVRMNKSKLGFTMIEMTIVLVMIGVLTASLLPLLLRQHTNSMEERDRTALDAAKTAIISYAMSFGGIPNPVEINGISGVVPPATGANAALGVNNWGAFGDSNTNLFRLDANYSLTVSGVAAVGGGAGEAKVVFCQAVNAQLTGAAASPGICQDINDRPPACATSIPAAFVLYSTGNDRVPNQENDEAGALGGNRIYENDKRGINNSPGSSHYDDQVMSYPLSALARDCREKMGVLPEVMSCAAGRKYVGSVLNNVASAVSYTLTGTTASSVPANGSVYVNQCLARSETMAVGSSAASQVSAMDTNADGRVDFIITGTNSFTAQ